MKPYASAGFFNTLSRTAAQAADPDHIKVTSTEKMSVQNATNGLKMKSAKSKG